MISNIDDTRRKLIKQSFATRRVPLKAIKAVDARIRVPQPGDVVLAKVTEPMRLRRLELTTGRRSKLYPGDEVLVTYGNRYAPDAYEALIPTDLGMCDLAAAGGLAGHVVETNYSFADEDRPPTKLQPLGLCVDADGKVINLSDFALPPAPLAEVRPPIITVFGASMNSGKTTTVAGIVRGLATSGLRVGAAKVTGTCSGGDLWKFTDAGAAQVFDFTDAGLATTYKTPLADVVSGAVQLVRTLCTYDCDVIVLEIADGLYQAETASLLQNENFRRMVDHWVYAAESASSIKLGVEAIRDIGLNLTAVSGAVTASPLAMREASQMIHTNMATLFDLEEGELPMKWLSRSPQSRVSHLMAAS